MAESVAVVTVLWTKSFSGLSTLMNNVITSWTQSAGNRVHTRVLSVLALLSVTLALENQHVGAFRSKNETNRRSMTILLVIFAYVAAALAHCRWPKKLTTLAVR